jgi:hypothetical protein
MRRAVEGEGAWSEPPLDTPGAGEPERGVVAVADAAVPVVLAGSADTRVAAVAATAALDDDDVDMEAVRCETMDDVRERSCDD